MSILESTFQQVIANTRKYLTFAPNYYYSTAQCKNPVATKYGENIESLFLGVFK
jgi:hypothetical protein